MVGAELTGLLQGRERAVDEALLAQGLVVDAGRRPGCRLVSQSITKPMVPVGATTVAWALRKPCSSPFSSALSQARAAAPASCCMSIAAASGCMVTGYAVEKLTRTVSTLATMPGAIRERLYLAYQDQAAYARGGGGPTVPLVRPGRS